MWTYRKEGPEGSERKPSEYRLSQPSISKNTVINNLYRIRSHPQEERQFWPDDATRLRYASSISGLNIAPSSQEENNDGDETPLILSGG